MLAEMKLKGGTMPKRQHDTDDDDPFDERGLLKDKRSVRVPMMMRDADGLTDLQRSMCDEFAPARVVDAFGDAGAGLHRPGSRYLVAGAETVDHAKQVTRDHMRAEAYADAVQQMCDAWRGPNVSDRECQRIHDTGNRIADALLDQLHDLQNSWSRKR
jgi:hypothetical protein